jgi:hypothetical protein
MAAELCAREDNGLLLEVWLLWISTEVRKLAQIGKEYGVEMFGKASFAFVKKYRDGEAENWVKQVVASRNESIRKRYIEITRDMVSS